MPALKFILETLSHLVKLVDSPPPGVPAHSGSSFEQDMMRLCERHRLTPIVSFSLGRLVLPPGLSAIALGRLKENEANISRNNARLLGKMKLAASAFQARGIPFVFAGDLASSDIYPVPTLRAVEGIDFLVRENDWGGLVECLRSIGFEPVIGRTEFLSPRTTLEFHQYFSPCVFKDGENDKIRLIFRVFDYGRPEVEEKAWEHTREPQTLSHKIRALGFEDHLIRSAVELNIRNFSDLRLVTDIGFLIGRFNDKIDRTYLEERLGSRGLYKAVYFSVRHVGNLLKLPGACAALRYPGRIRENVFQELWGTNRVDYFEKKAWKRRPLKFYLLESGHIAGRVSLLRAKISPDPGLVSEFFGEPYGRLSRTKFVLRSLLGKWEENARKRVNKTKVERGGVTHIS